MEQNFLDEICDVFMNESEIRLNERIEGERFKGVPKWWNNVITYEEIAWTKVKLETPW